MDEDQKWHPYYLGNPVYAVLPMVFFEWGVARHDLEVENIVTGPFFPLTLAGNATANLVRNPFAFNIIFCGHVPAGALTFSEEECADGPDGQETRDHWYYRQVLGSANISGGPLFHVLSGDRSHQIEHHLFPNLPARRYPQIASEVREICERYGIDYTTGPLRKQLMSVAKKICPPRAPGPVAQERIAA